MTTSLAESTDPWCLSPNAADRLLVGAPWRRFAVIGDSLSAGTCDPVADYVDMGWSDRVAEVLRRGQHDFGYLNVAQVGASTRQVLANQVDRLITFAPDLVHVPSGANDLRRAEPDWGAIENRLRRLYAAAAGTGAQLTCFTLGRAYVVAGFADWSQRVQRMNAITRRVAAEHNAVMVDMWGHPVNDRPDLLSADGIHFAAAGQAVMAAEVIRALAATIASPCGRPVA